MNELILMTLSGSDKPGVTSAVTDILARYEVNILDIGQAVIHDTLSLGLLIDVPPEAESSPILKELLFKAHELNMATRFEPIDAVEYQRWVEGQGKSRHIITLLARRITAEHIAGVTEIAARYALNIDNISRLSGRISLDDQHDERGKACVEFSVRDAPQDDKELRESLMGLSSKLGVDIAFQRDDIFRRTRRLVVFDMDSTLIEHEVIDELAIEAGVGDQVAEITEAAMRGELDFNESFRKRVALLKGLDESVLAQIAGRLKLTEGAEELMLQLKRTGYKTAILSGGFTYFAETLQRKLGFDYIYANQLDIIDGKVTGEVRGEIVNGERKAKLLREIADREGIRLEQTIAVGDGANDLPMLSIAGLGIAFRAKPLVRKSAKQSISNLGLDGILYLLGFRDRDSER